jgi:signal transduction histidine kinase
MRILTPVISGNFQSVFCKAVLPVFLWAGSFTAAGQRPEAVVVFNSKTKAEPVRNPVKSFAPLSQHVAKDYNNDILAADSFTRLGIPPEKVTRKILLRFTLINRQDVPDSCYFFPGFFFSNVLLYKVENEKAIPLPVIAPPIKDNISFRLIAMKPHDSLTILAECYMVKTYTNVLRLRIIGKNYLSAFVAELQQANKDVSLFTYVLCGLLLMMILFSLATYFQGRSHEFLYYVAYAFFLGFMLFTKQYYYNRSYFRNFFFEAYLDFVFQCLGIGFFMAFMIRFLETRKYFPFLHKLYLTGIIFLSAVIIAFTYLHYGTDNYYAENLLENYITKGLLLLMMVIFLIYAARHWHFKLLRYLFWGNLFYLLFSLYSLVIVINPAFPAPPGLLGNSLVLYELGLLIELIFFLMGLVYKNRTQLVEQVKERERLKAENERKELEKQMAVLQAYQDERERISADMHDELGSGMTSIRLMSEIAKNKLKENIPPEIEKISSSANDLLNKMNAIIWSMNSSNDTVDSLIYYIRAYAIEYLDGTPIECKVKMPENIPMIELGGDKRRNIFLCVKETLNNTLKHAQATRVDIEMEVNDELKIVIADNGIGIDVENTRQFGNGLRNISRRMKHIGGRYSIFNKNGTVSRIELPL